jgi:hypothetical protein
MTPDFGSGAPLKDASPWLQDDAVRHARILQVTECNSVIEGLPPFQDDSRERIAAELAAIAALHSQERRG